MNEKWYDDLGLTWEIVSGDKTPSTEQAEKLADPSCSYCDGRACREFVDWVPYGMGSVPMPQGELCDCYVDALMRIDGDLRRVEMPEHKARALSTALEPDWICGIENEKGDVAVVATSAPDYTLNDEWGYILEEMENE